MYVKLTYDLKEITSKWVDKVNVINPRPGEKSQNQKLAVWMKSLQCPKENHQES